MEQRLASGHLAKLYVGGFISEEEFIQRKENINKNEALTQPTGYSLQKVKGTKYTPYDLPFDEESLVEKKENYYQVYSIPHTDIREDNTVVTTNSVQSQNIFENSLSAVHCSNVAGNAGVFLNFDKKAPATQASAGAVPSRNVKLQFMETSGVIHTIPSDFNATMDTVIDKLAKLMKCKKEQISVSFNGAPVLPADTVQQLNIESADILLVKTSISFDAAPVGNNYTISEYMSTYSSAASLSVPKFDYTTYSGGYSVPAGDSAATFSSVSSQTAAPTSSEPGFSFQAGKSYEIPETLNLQASPVANPVPRASKLSSGGRAKVNPKNKKNETSSAFSFGSATSAAPFSFGGNSSSSNPSSTSSFPSASTTDSTPFSFCGPSQSFGGNTTSSTSPFGSTSTTAATPFSFGSSQSFGGNATSPFGNPSSSSKIG